MFAILAVCSLCWIVRVLDRQVRRILWIINWNIIMYYSFFFLIALVLEGLGQMDCAGVAGVIPGLKGASATCNLQPGNQLDCLLQIPEPRKSTGLIQIRKIPQPGKKAIALCLIHCQVVHKTGMILFPLLERIAVLLEVNIMEILSLIRVPVFPSSSPLVDQTNWGREDSTTSEMRI